MQRRASQAYLRTQLSNAVCRCPACKRSLCSHRMEIHSGFAQNGRSSEVIRGSHPMRIYLHILESI
jgi:hypothetical protein